MDDATRRLIRSAPLVVADFDGTLATLAVDWPALKRRLARAAAVATLPWDEADGLERNLRRIRSLTEVGFRDLCSHVAAAEVVGFTPMAVNEALLSVLRQRGHAPFGICSANTRPALELLLSRPTFFGLRPVLVAKEDVQQGKPDPEGLLRLCQHFGCPPEAALFIGDMPSDEAAAKAIDMAFLWAQHTRRIPLDPACPWPAPVSANTVSVTATDRPPQAPTPQAGRPTPVPGASAS